MVDLKTRRERVVRTYQNYRDADVAVSPDGKYFALCETFTATTPPVNQTAAILWKKSFIEIRDGFSGKKIASLRADEGFHSNTAMVFASDNSALYFRNRVMERWPRARWKIGVPYSKIRAPGK